MKAREIDTTRLILRDWKEEDLLPFSELNRDPTVMEFMPKQLSKEESDELATKIKQELHFRPYGLWAVEVKGGAPFIGFVGLHYQDFEAHFTPCVEIGWRLRKEAWGQGYATEAAMAVLEVAFCEIKLDEVVSFTYRENMRSLNVMRKIGLKRDVGGDFMHSKMPKDHPLAPQILYRISKDEFFSFYKGAHGG